MCGIAGIYNFNQKEVKKEQIKRMTDVMAHRGPDGKGVFVDGNLGLGHRRLAVIDLSEAGHQPMSDSEGFVWLSYNGEVYNFLNLKKELKKRGYDFKSRTDTEVIILAYKEWGIDCLKRFNGMFAFALFDKRKQKLFLARDRYGAKPLYYFFTEKNLVFASEVKAMIAAGFLQAKIDLLTLKEYFTFQNVLSDRTFFEGVRLLPAGSFAEINLNSERKNFKIRKFWDYDFNSEGFSLSKEETQERIHELFIEAVKRQLIADVPVGSYLSGGIDSGSVVALGSGYFKEFHTFTIGFDLSGVSGRELGYDERKYAKIIADRFHTEHHEKLLGPLDIKPVLPKLVWHLENLRVGQSYPDYYVAGLANKFVKVALSGAGGDELFGGYPWRYSGVLSSKNRKDYLERYYNYWQRLVKDNQKEDFFTQKVWREVRDYSTFDVFCGIFKDRKGNLQLPQDYINECLYFEIKTFLQGLLLIGDKLNMAHSVEGRFPFLDNEFVDFAMKVPVSYKLKEIEKMAKVNKGELLRYDQRADRGKVILREVLRNLVPPEIWERPKQGFSAPDASWYRGPSRSYIKEVLFSRQTLNRGYFQPDFIKKVVEEHTSGKADHKLLIWSLLCFEWWNRMFLDQSQNG